MEYTNHSYTYHTTNMCKKISKNKIKSNIVSEYITPQAPPSSPTIPPKKDDTIIITIEKVYKKEGICKLEYSTDTNKLIVEL